jgi:hypothetical protein
MENIALLGVCFLLGIVLRRSGRLPENAPSTVNGFIIHISLPALILLYVHRLPLDLSLLYPVAAPWVLFFFGLVLFVTAARAARWSAQTTGGLILSGSLANTSFVGLPMIEAFYGAAFNPAAARHNAHAARESRSGTAGPEHARHRDRAIA